LLGLRYLESGKASDAFNLGNGNGFSVRTVLDTAQRITGRTIKSTSAARRSGDPHTLVGSSLKARRVLGWAPRFDRLETIIETAWKWHQASAELAPPMRSSLSGAG